jgi:CDP-6-deoxy-D-xylo-4-hexulose-3-dehydrase
MSKLIRLAFNTLSKNDIFDLINWLKKYNPQQLPKGKLTIKFEGLFSKYLKRKYSVFVNSGSSANLLIAQALLEAKYIKNKIIIAPALSWVTTVTPFIQLGYQVILCDCDKEDLGLDINHLKILCKKYKPSSIILVNVLGHSNKFKEILLICKMYNIKIIEDNCEALGSQLHNKKLGSFGLASSNSFYFGHHISTIEGGMVSTNDKYLYNVMLSLRSHGWARDMNNNYKKKLEIKYKINEIKSLYTFYYSGFNIRSTDLNAFLGINQLKKINTISKIRNNNYLFYKKNLKNYWSQNSNLNVISSFGYGTMTSNRLDVYRYLKKNNIESRPLICGNIAQQPFWKKLNLDDKNLPNAEKVDEFGIYLPNHANLKEKDIFYVCSVFKKIAKNFFF